MRQNFLLHHGILADTVAKSTAVRSNWKYSPMTACDDVFQSCLKPNKMMLGSNLPRPLNCNKACIPSRILLAAIGQ
uniref:Uncharacterized protein n=1 Tax=Romanomermis culicivorax TaxID=13658 RepID=A0A915K8V5_ROMCU